MSLKAIQGQAFIQEYLHVKVIVFGILENVFICLLIKS